MLAALAALTLSMSAQATHHTFSVQGEHFMLDGKPFLIRSGEIHYPRIPHQYWRSRLKMAKAMGLNTICTYVFWNLHEPTEGKWDFQGDNDLGQFIKMAGEEGLFVIVRPGPYICTEWDLGGFPAWLLKDRSMTIRSNDAKFLKITETYMKKVGDVIKPYLMKNGGPIIMAQVENEYGSYGSDHVYMAAIRDMMKRSGFDCTLFTSDGPSQSMLKAGTLPDLTPTINFGGGAPNAFAELAKFRTGVPRMIGEFWAGWFDHWGKQHAGSNIQNNVKDMEWCLENGVSFNVYMFHGGTNFGFMQGSNGGTNDYNVDITSYDYDSALNESGRVTPKYIAFRDTIAKATGEKLPEIPAMPAPITIAKTKLTQSSPLRSSLPAPVKSESVKTFEDLDQSYGIVLYRTTLPTAGKQTLTFDKLHDYAIVLVDGVKQGVLDRRKQERTITIEVPKAGATLDVMVESLSRVNFGGLIPTERKGLQGSVKLGTTDLKNWEHYRLPLSAPPKNLSPVTTALKEPLWYYGDLEVAEPGDTFLDLRNFTKGFVWVNGKNLGRFWRIGPQQTLYLPGVWLNKGKNKIVVLEDSGKVENPTIEGLNEPILDEVAIDYSRLLRKPGQDLNLAGLKPTKSGSLPEGTKAQTVMLDNPVDARYFCLEALNSQGGDQWTALAELWILDENGNEIPRTDFKVLYADSEEINGENGSAANLIDLQPTTIWHTQWQGAKAAKHPHSVVLDLGKSYKVGGVKLLPRQEGANGRIKDFNFYFSQSPFKGI